MDVILTGTGCPIPDASRAGPGVLVRTGGLRFLFDAGRGTLGRLAACNFWPGDVDLVFLTHHHSDHTMGLPDLAHTRWLQASDTDNVPLPVAVPSGPCEDYLARALEAFAVDVEARKAHTGKRGSPAFDVWAFEAAAAAQVVWRSGDVAVSSVAVHHEPVSPAVAYRVDSPEGSVVISGDTSACDEMVVLAQGADVLVHEAMRKSVVTQWPARHVIADYHTGCHELGELAQRSGVENLVATHLIPPPNSPAEAEEFALGIREGGFTGRIVVADDLTTFHTSTSEFEVSGNAWVTQGVA